MFWQDVRYGIRSLRMAPGFAGVAIVSLALGIGANSTVYRVIDELLLHDVTADRPDRLLRVGDFGISYPNYRELSGSGVFQSFALYGLINFNWREANSTERVFSMITSPNFFETVGVAAARGRIYSDADANSMPAIVSDSFWRNRLGGDRTVLGRGLVLNDQKFTVIGVMAPEYRSVMGLGIVPEIYVPASQAIVPDIEMRDRLFFGRMVGRMPDGATRAQVVAALQAQQHRMQHAYPAIARDLEQLSGRVEAIGGIGRMLDDKIDGRAFLTFYSLLALVVSLVLVIACANVSGLLIARGAARRREIAVRAALGAGRRRLIAQFLTEGLVLALCGAALGLVVNFWLTKLLSQVRVPYSLPFVFSFAPDARLMWYTLAVTALTAPLCALIPAMRASRTDLVSGLKAQRGELGRTRLRNVMVMGQVALSFVLMAGALLFIRATVVLRSVNPGFDIDHTILADVTPVDKRNFGDAFTTYRERLLDQVRSTAGVVEVSSGMPPLNPDMPVVRVRVAGTLASEARTVTAMFVGPDYFSTMRIAVAGREFERRDETRMPVAGIVNETMARQFFPGGDAIGRRLIFAGRNGKEQEIEIVGVCADSKVRTLGEIPSPVLYREDLSSQLIVRVAGNAEALVAPVRRALHQADPGAAAGVQTMRDYASIALWPARIGAGFLIALSGLGLALALVGLYGVIAFVVARRTSEIGVRMALGASRAGVLWMVLADAAKVIGAGIAVGAAASILAMRPLGLILPSSLSTRDPVTFALAVVVIIAASAAAVIAPARRASRIDPAVALKYE